MQFIFNFADRSLSLQDVLDICIDIIGTPNADLIHGAGMNERITALAGAGNNVLFKFGGNDMPTSGITNDPRKII